MMKTINLEEYTQGRISVLGTKVKGADIREQLKLDEIDSMDENVEIIVPDYIVTFTPSFFLGLFSKSLNTLGEDAFFQKYDFSKNRMIIQKQIIEGLDDWKSAR